MANHSCAPNACAAPGNPGTLRALRDIAEGDEITIMYTKRNARFKCREGSGGPLARIPRAKRRRHAPVVTGADNWGMGDGDGYQATDDGRDGSSTEMRNWSHKFKTAMSQLWNSRSG
ncbi:unnamed protein product [Parascedosporium putredinis]|uniref:SET domain-containing protein n=1 Tax=Parascedosporium putredinis TaxID=1442378 RepID=A0A9P1H4M7_9PEZI|nr:unnamed protein product [Parascedosporium putredinis]CAI7998426.1 unnamed protein product [Parascedosporium putredinis]